MEYEEANELILIAEKVKIDNNLRYLDIEKIQFLKVDKIPKIGNCELIGKCTKVQPRYRKLLDKDFIIEFTPIFFDKHEDMQEMFMLHELLHIEKDNENIRQHDYEEFKEILEKYGDKYYKELSITLKEAEIKTLEEKKKQLEQQIQE